ncbi:hypothetical protein EPJ72_02245 [Brachyspira pilosicoli]|uniref:Uncharacterized protein n=1 Tax=Brachyspira pilosicoli TaxID=52584 RepID=A0A5C8F8I5_BRAPL|nr:hypothetical protein EPJ72_02245 [Brachyspira pilosicoli]
MAESGTFIVDGDNYREPPEDLDIGKKTKWILHSKYYFTSNLMHYLFRSHRYCTFFSLKKAGIPYNIYSLNLKEYL